MSSISNDCQSEKDNFSDTAKEHINEYNNLIKMFDEYLLSSDTSKLEIKVTLSSSMRRRIYEKLKVDYCGKLLHTYTKHKNGNENYVVLYLFKYNDDSQQQIDALNIKDDDMLVSYFDRYFKSGLPVLDSKTMNYYLNALNPYRGTKETFANFRNDVVKMGSIGKLNAYINDILQIIKDFISTKEAFKKFIATVYSDEAKYINTSPYKTVEALYSTGAENKMYISVDIRKANYTMLSQFCPEVFAGFDSWESFVNKFDNNQLYTLSNSKFLREKLFGTTVKSNKIKLLSEYTVRKFIESLAIKLNMKDSINAQIVLLSGDEVVFNYTEELLKSIKEECNMKIFKIETFHLKKLPKYNYFVKEYFSNDPSDITKKEFKCIPSNCLMECIKVYEGKPVEDLDLRFTADNGRVAKFEKPLYQ